MPQSTPVPAGHKLCRKKPHVKSHSEFARRSDGHGDGFQSMCRECYREHRRECYQDPGWRSRQAASKARWSARNPTYQADYYQLTRLTKIAKTRAYKKVNPTDPERQREYSRAWELRDPEGARAKVRRANSRRRARLAGLPSENYTAKQILDRDGKDCVLCGRVLNLAVTGEHPMSATVEHLECISWPGSAGDVLANVALSHRTCNEKRGTKPHPAAARKRAELLAAEQEALPA